MNADEDCAVCGHDVPCQCPKPVRKVPHVNDGAKQAAPFVRPAVEAVNARIVREALRAVAMEETGKAHEHLWQAAVLASDGTLTKLKRLLKH